MCVCVCVCVCVLFRGYYSCALQKEMNFWLHPHKWELVNSNLTPTATTAQAEEWSHNCSNQIQLDNLIASHMQHLQ